MINPEEADDLYTRVNKVTNQLASEHDGYGLVVFMVNPENGVSSLGYTMNMMNLPVWKVLSGLVGGIEQRLMNPNLPESNELRGG